MTECEIVEALCMYIDSKFVLILIFVKEKLQVLFDHVAIVATFIKRFVYIQNLFILI